MGITHIRLAGASTLLAASGVLTIAGSAQRWWPACRLGAFDSGGCPELQGDPYDYSDPSIPWTPVGMAAELHGSGMLVLAVAVLLIPGVLAGRRPGWMLTTAAILVSAAVAGIALPTLLSGLVGEVVSLPHMWLPAILYIIGLPVLLIVSGVRAAPASSRVSLARFATVLLLIVANNVIILHLMVVPAILMYSSYDTTPWAEAVGGAFLIAAAAVIWLTSSRDPVPVASDGGSAVLQQARLTQTG